MSRHLFTPPTAPVRPSPYPTPDSNVPSASGTAPSKPQLADFVPRNDFEKAILALGIPFSNFQFRSDEALALRMRGQDPAEIDRAIQSHHDLVNRRMAEWGGQLKVLGLKPKKGDRNFQFYTLPNSNSLVIRIWHGGAEEFNHYFLDLFNLVTEAPSNLPSGYEMHALGRPGMGLSGRLLSFENAMGVPSDKILPGEEKFFVPEGTQLRLVRPSQPDFFFLVPTRQLQQQFALPTGF